MNHEKNFVFKNLFFQSRLLLYEKKYKILHFNETKFIIDFSIRVSLF